ncbi:MAG: insulinase family protein, partial [Rhodoferax sp.]
VTDNNLSTGVEADLGFNSDPTLHVIIAPLAPGAKHDEVEKAILQEIERLKREGVSASELQAAIAKTQADAAFKRDGSFAVAEYLNECIAAGDWSLFYALDDATQQVTTADIQRVANSYLNEDHSTTGWFVPTVPGSASSAPQKAGRSRLHGPSYYRSPDASAASAPTQEGSGEAAPARMSGGRIAPNASRMMIAGIDVIAYPTGVKNVVSLRASLPAGRSMAGAGNPSIPALTGMLLDQGTQKQDKFAITEKLEAVGASIHFDVGTDLLQISAKSLKKDVPLVLELIAEQLRMPAFSAEELLKAKKQYAGSIKRSLEDPDFRAADAFSRAIYPVHHPNRIPDAQDLLAAIEAARLEDITAFHKAHYGPAQMKLVLVGDLDLGLVQAELGRSFSGWQDGGKVVATAFESAAHAPQSQNVVMPDKNSVSVVLGQASGLRYRDPDYQALRLATAILGSGFTGRLMAQVRDKEGLTYDVGARLANDMLVDGDWRIFATFAPELLEQGLASTKRQLAMWHESGVTDAEIEARKSSLIGSFKVDLATTGGMSNALLSAVNRGYDLTWLDDFPLKVNALTGEQINGAIRRHLKPDQMVLIKAGTFP